MNIILPWVPSVNSLYRTIVRGKFPTVIISKKGREFFAEVAAMFADKNIVMMTGDLEVWIKMYPPDRRRRDIDNGMKATLDSIQKAGLIFDDSQIKKLHAEMFKPEKPGRVEVRLEVINYDM